MQGNHGRSLVRAGHRGLPYGIAARCLPRPSNGQSRWGARRGSRIFGAEEELLEEPWISNEPLTFEVGAGDIVGNKLFQGFDEAVRGLEKGESIVLESQSEEWKSELLFKIPVAHPEIQRLQGRYQLQGGLEKGKIVELVNKQLAIVIDVTDTHVTLDANSMMAGKHLTFELLVDEIVSPAS